ncbi:MAG: DNA-directed RNA polymerase subunit omega [Aeriscardovia sp.]|nr:DNA-directed RNA polymerase subunit omega [Aeriscardovia sp.]MBQ3480585.1 DNA-directed RNA polymerase subunit omega [Aeriscardovia sp.]MBR2673368.1 DNA-directed RNA polymerase subunit omega [Aeriscardovia sp.]
MPLGTTPEPQGLGNPPIDELMKHADSKYALSIFAAKRARQINSYFNQLNEGLLQNVGPLVEYQNDDKPLSIAFREINEGLLEETLGADEKDDDLQAQKLINASTGISVSAADIVDAAAVDAEDEAEDANDVDEDDDSEEIESDALSLLNDNDEDDDSDDE